MSRKGEGSKGKTEVREQSREAIKALNKDSEARYQSLREEVAWVLDKHLAEWPLGELGFSVVMVMDRRVSIAHHHIFWPPDPTSQYVGVCLMMELFEKKFTVKSLAELLEAHTGQDSKKAAEALFKGVRAVKAAVGMKKGTRGVEYEKSVKSMLDNLVEQGAVRVEGGKYKVVGTEDTPPYIQ